MTKKFKSGDYVIALIGIEFMYGESHIKGHTYEIKDGCEAYYNVMQKDYTLVGRRLSGN